jgi:PAS domain S-box-containing protein
VSIASFARALVRRSMRATLNETPQTYRDMAVLSRHIVWTASPSGEVIPVDDGWEAITGCKQRDWVQQVHPDEVEDINAKWQHSISTGEDFESVHRLRTSSGEYRWMHARGYPFRDSKGKIVYWYGTTEDIHERIQAETELQLLHKEVDHRARNLMSVVLGLIKLAPRDSTENFIDAVERRIISLSKTYTLMAESHWESVNLHELLSRELEPYSNIEIEGREVQLIGRMVQPVSMIIHELTTNAAKYGSLSVPEGGLKITTKVTKDRSITITWIEHGGPLCSHPNHLGFGSKLISANTERGCKIERDWDEAGLRITLIIENGICETAR